MGAGVNFENILHPPHELGVRFGRDGPLLLQMGLKFVFF
jgi:hypothetical protein